MDIRNLVNTLRSKLGLPNPEQTMFGLRDEYQKYVLESQMNGQPPLPFGDFVRQKQMGNAPVAPVQGPGGGIPPAAPGYDTFFKR